MYRPCLEKKMMTAVTLLFCSMETSTSAKTLSAENVSDVKRHVRDALRIWAVRSDMVLTIDRFLRWPLAVVLPIIIISAGGCVTSTFPSPSTAGGLIIALSFLVGVMVLGVICVLNLLVPKQREYDPVDCGVRYRLVRLLLSATPANFLCDTHFIGWFMAWDKFPVRYTDDVLERRIADAFIELQMKGSDAALIYVVTQQTVSLLVGDALNAIVVAMNPKTAPKPAESALEAQNKFLVLSTYV